MGIRNGQDLLNNQKIGYLAVPKIVKVYMVRLTFFFWIEWNNTNEKS